ncbi:hypothetical protein D8674_010914 [Pyrus ussuriensis x Pyrus communis]|uniref:Uncharacterized protein n=1 Tax=Pyrus ussuriensis x Pyrus communis TaxID=2448454 RepID=A0A5N5FX82_9ROSA|nr:hypothetical protein D8674_010914 [Pyrus ussuriensis x Pyrus communis]
MATLGGGRCGADDEGEAPKLKLFTWQSIESFVSTCDDLPNPMEEDMDDFEVTVVSRSGREVVKGRELLERMADVNERRKGVLKVKGILGRKI